MNHRTIRKAICRLGRQLIERGLVHGTTGNISARVSDGYIVTPTGVALDQLDARELAQLTPAGGHLGGAPPTKEASLHRAIYESRPQARAIVHTHSRHCVAVTLLPAVNPDDALPPLTPYYLMRVGHAPVVPYFPPGDPELAETVGRYAAGRQALLLAHHGPVVAGATLDEAASILAELEETARLFFLLRPGAYRTLEPDDVATLRDRFPTENT